jgi:hypothetical protein
VVDVDFPPGELPEINTALEVDRTLDGDRIADPGLKLLGFEFAKICWIGLFLGFAIKVPNLGPPRADISAVTVRLMWLASRAAVRSIAPPEWSRHCSARQDGRANGA